MRMFKPPKFLDRALPMPKPNLTGPSTSITNALLIRYKVTNIKRTFYQKKCGKISSKSIREMNKSYHPPQWVNVHNYSHSIT